MQENQKLILVNEQDEVLGTMEKMEAHRKGILHRAFSVFIFNNKGEMLLQQRALNKYHCGGLWTNSCCSHPFPGEGTEEGARRRLLEELGFTTELTKIFHFIYNSEFENGLTEHEFDHVYVGIYDGPINADKDEIADYSYKSIPEIQLLMEAHPEKYTPWFRMAFPGVVEWIDKNYFSLKATLV